MDDKNLCNSTKVQDILRIFEGNDEAANNNNNNKNKNEGESLVSLSTWSVRRRKQAPSPVSAPAPNLQPAKTQEQKRVSEIVQCFQGKQPLTPTPNVLNHRPHASSHLKIKINSGDIKEELYADISVGQKKTDVPSGPPPQKPHRTFEHDIYLEKKSRSFKEASKPSLPPKPTRSKTVPTIKASSPRGKCPERPRTPPPRPPPMLAEKTSELKKCHSAEKIYDEPWCSSWEEIRKRRKTVNACDFQLVDNDIYSSSGRPPVKSQLTGNHELFYMSTPLFPTSSSPTKHSKPFVFPRPLKAHNLGSKGGLGRGFGSVKANRVQDKDVLNWSFMSIYGPSASRDIVMAKDLDSSESDTEISENEVQKRIEYVHNVTRTPSLRCDPNENRFIYRKHFDCVLVVGLRFEGNDTSTYQPYVKNIYPSEECLMAASPESIANFCFPDAQIWRPAASRETYTFVLTSDKGDRIYGYCRRVKPEGVEYNIPVVYCVLSPVLDRVYYSQLLGEIEKRHGLPDTKIKSFIQTLYSRSLPLPGKTTIIRRSSLDGETQVALMRSNEYFADNSDTWKLLSRLSISSVIKIFSSFLLERRVLFCASQPEVLTQTIHSLVSLLHPFYWPHTLIPILPSNIINMVALPTPYIIGILSAHQEFIDESSLEQEVMIVDLDSKQIVKEIGDETTILPRKVQKALATALKLFNHRTKHEDDDVETLIPEAFLRMFIELTGHYQQHISINHGKKIFNRDTFINALPSKGIQMFLKWFTETQIFDIYIHSICSSTTSNGVFEQRVNERQLDLDGLKSSSKYNVKEFSKKMKNFGEKLIGLKSPK